ncbi:InlB B-repeat-containing protein [Saccharibacillus sp. JS10]|uniref:InlB B-repeat-containing protein n=1 Tax=Saccharibacillus sp. JS10 TaxID=2950552 RepID=UPI00210C57F9|nr:InlB B-repeat-containing protein [Saccharibacillus sp. JS10]MCQ4086847.1 InlB B-repeat-containing protein [Saccharibacillus sp. JS10]
MSGKHFNAFLKVMLAFVLVFGAVSVGPKFTKSAHAMGAEPYIGEIKLFPYSFASRGWTFAAGQTMDINRNQALYSLFGTMYGGNGRDSFALPDLTSLPVPDGMAYYVATSGIYPTRPDGDNQSAPNLEAFAGEVRLFAYSFVPNGWRKLDGSTLNQSDYPKLSAAIDPSGSPAFTLPKISLTQPNVYFAIATNPAGTQSGNQITINYDSMLLGETISFLKPMNTTLLPTDGRQMSGSENQALYSLLVGRFGSTGNYLNYFLPNLMSNPYSFSYYMAPSGVYPSRDNSGNNSSTSVSKDGLSTISDGRSMTIYKSEFNWDRATNPGISLRTATTHGSIVDLGNSFLYTADAKFSGTDRFTVRSYNSSGFATGYSTININVVSPVPVINNVSNGGIYNHPVTPTVTNNGSATLNGVPFTSGTAITQDGKYTLIAINAYGTAQVQFEIDLTPPILSGLTDNSLQTTAPTITFNEGTALLNGVPFTSGTTISQEGNYEIVVTDKAGNTASRTFMYYKPRQLEFNSLGGTSIPAQAVTYDSFGTKPTDPTRTGYAFVNWYVDESFTNIFDIAATRIKENTTLYAKWSPNEYVLNLHYNNNDGVKNAPIFYGAKITRPADPAKLGHTFAGWYTDLALSQPFDFENTLVTQNTNLYAKWAVNTYTVSFDSQGGTAVGNLNADYETKIAPPIAPTRTGYTFTGWYTDASNQNLFNFSNTSIAENTQLYAGWELNTYHVQFDSQGGSAVSDLPVKHGLSIDEPTSPTRIGYIFTGWYTDTDHTQLFDFATSIVGDTQLYAGWKANVHNISFDSNGGSAVADLAVDFDSKIQEPAAPTRVGHDFTGWYSDEDLKQSFDFTTQTVSGDATLYAGWSLQKYTVNFDVYEGADVPDQLISYGDLIQAPANPEQPGYTFINWYEDADYTQIFDFQKIIENSTTIYAGWKINGYTAVFDSNGGSEVNSQPLNFGSLLTEPQAPVRDGHTFIGWFTDPNFEHPVDWTTLKIKGDMTLYANWERHQHTVTFDTYGGSAIDDQTILYGDTLTAPTSPTSDTEGYVFAGWFSDPNRELPFDFSQAITEDLTVYAKWAIQVHSVMFDSNGGTSVDPQQAAYGDRLSRPANPERSGYTFGGWYKDAQLEQIFDFNHDRVTSDLTLYAAWNVALYTATFESNGGSKVEPQIVENATLWSRPNDPVRMGYVFTGWYMDQNLSQAFDFATTTANSDVKLYAGWSLVPPPSGGNGGTGNNGGSSIPTNPDSGAAPASPIPTPPNNTNPNQATVTIPVGQAGNLRIGNGMLLEVPAGAADRPLEIKGSLFSSPLNGINSNAKLISPVYEFTKNITENFKVPVQLTLNFDRALIPNNQSFAVFYQTQDNTPWIEIEDGIINGNTIKVGVNHFTRFAVMTIPPKAIEFSDMVNHWAAASVREASSLGIIEGYADQTFRPSQAVTKAEFTVMLMRTLQPQVADNLSSPHSFADASSIGAWAKKEVNQAVALGWVTGDTNNRFAPNQPISRAEMAVMIDRSMKLNAPTTKAAFADDSDIPNWAKEAANRLHEAGLVQGQSANRFAPAAPTTRAEAAQLLIRIRQN